MNITRSDCEEILRKDLGSHSFQLIDHEILKIGSFMGFLGEYHQIKLKYESNGKVQSSSYFAKSLPIANEAERKIQLAQGFHLKENKIYAELFPKIALPGDNWCPQYFFVKEDILVLENLAIKGYKTLPIRFELKEQHLNLALTTLAQFHSRSLIYGVKYPAKNIAREFSGVLTDKGFIASNPWLQNGFRTIEKVAEKIGCFEKFDFRDQIYQKLGGFLTRMYEPENDIVKVLSHSDLWKSNLMFLFEDSLDNPLHCLLLDFQMAKNLPLPIDALILIFLNTRRESRDESLKAYLSFYYEKLKKELHKHSIEIEQIVTYEKFIDSCDYFKLVALAYHAIATMITYVPTEMYIKMSSAEYDQFMVKDRFPFVSNIMDTDDDYNENVVEAVEELIEYLASSS